MAPASPKPQIPWIALSWFGLLIAACTAPALHSLVTIWANDGDMGHGFFVPLIAAFIIWQKRQELLAIEPKPNLWGLMVVILGGAQLVAATLGVELFLTHTAVIVTLIGVIWLLRGTETLKMLAFPLFLLFFMVPIPLIVYNKITFPLQLIASRLASGALDLLGIPVLRDGNILELPHQTLSVVEACSGIRSLLSLTFLSLVYGYFFEKRIWLRVVLFVATVPIAIIANGSRITFTGIMTQIKPELAEGFFHESTGWVIFIVALIILVLFHQLMVRTLNFVAAKRAHA
ncbi:MAG: exosortase [Bryobacteraceae bacterium]